MKQVVIGLLLLVAMVSLVKRKNPTLPLPSEHEAIEVLKPPAAAAKSVQSLQTMTSEPAAVPSVSRKEFKALTENVLQSFPEITKLRKMSSAELHHTPELLREAGRNLGRVAQTVEDHPELASEGRQFYKACFLKKELPQPLRALCLANHRDLRVIEGGRPDWTAEERKTGMAVLQLAAAVPLP